MSASDSNDPVPAGSNASPPVPTDGRLLGLDYGSKRVGVAVCDPEQRIATPLDVIHRHTAETDIAALRSIVGDYVVKGIVVGLPVHMSGDEGEKAREARTFGDAMGRALNLPVCYHDERFTTSLADEQMRAAGMNRRQRQGRLDQVAAQLMLQSYIDAVDRDQAPISYRHH